MSAAGSLIGRKRERLAQSSGPKAPAGLRGAAKALERLATAHAACARLLTGETYPDSLSELALTLQRIFGAKLVVLRDGIDPLGVSGVAPAHVEARGWLEALRQRHLEGHDSSISTFDLAASDTAPPIGGIRRFVVAPLSPGRGHGALWLGFGDHGPSSPDELMCISLLGEHLSLALQQAAAKPSSNGAPALSLDMQNGKNVSPPGTMPLARADDLISLAAHELRTPLTPITMLLQSLERKARAGTADVETILRARKQVNRLTQMISDLLDLSRLREDRLILTPVRLDLGKVVREAIQSFRQTDAKHPVELRDETASIEVMVDESRLQHTLINLLDHVAHATPTGGIIEVILQRRDPSASITVRADRPVFGGEAPKTADVVGPPHARAEPVALGVLLAQGITTRLGGTLSLVANRANETRVEATFPLSTAD
jgi:hypothetical protein